jgi:hypothetical protein
VLHMNSYAPAYEIFHYSPSYWKINPSYSPAIRAIGASIGAGAPAVLSCAEWRARKHSCCFASDWSSCADEKGEAIRSSTTRNRRCGRALKLVPSIRRDRLDWHHASFVFLYSSWHRCSEKLMYLALEVFIFGDFLR